MISDQRLMIFMQVFKSGFEIQRPSANSVTGLITYSAHITDLILTELNKYDGACAWQLSEDDVWEGACGIKWVFTANQDPAAHGVNFCPRCGRTVQVKEA